MKIIYSDDHRLHAGAKELVFGELVPMFEKPERMDMILKRIEELGYGEMIAPESFGLESILAVHDEGYVIFLSEAYQRWHEDYPNKPVGMPYVFPLRGLRQAPGGSVPGQFGYYCFDLSVPFVEGSWQAIKRSADVALTGQRLVAGGERAVFSLCRPPGHHAMRDMGGGYCYVNNAAVAAQAFRDGGAGRVAILDVDYHHGNGTQSIFYARNDVLFVSLHGHPDQEYPHYAGFAEERGEAAGTGFNVNYPMPWGTGWKVYAEALDDGIAKIRAFGPDVLVVSLGVDTFKEDPISHFKLEGEDYLGIGEKIAALDRPTHFVMEGGYAVEEIGINAINVLLGFEEAR